MSGKVVPKLVSIKTAGADCLEKIRASRERLSASEKKLADFILLNPHLIRDYSSVQLAKAAELSQSSVVKFSQNLGYTGFTELKLAITEAVLRQGASSFNLEDSASYKHLLSNDMPGFKHELGETFSKGEDLRKIELSLDLLSANERKLADFLLENAELIRDYSSQKIASAAGVSQSSVVKFSQKMGYRGFTDLKMAIHDSVVRKSLSDKTLGKGEEALQDITNSKIDAISKTRSINKFHRIAHVASRIQESGSVQIHGSPDSLFLKQLSEKLMSLGKPVLIRSILDKPLNKSNRALIFVVLDNPGKRAIDVLESHKSLTENIVVIQDHEIADINNEPSTALYYTSNKLNKFSNEITETSQQHLIDMLVSQLKSI